MLQGSPSLRTSCPEARGVDPLGQCERNLQCNQRYPESRYITETPNSNEFYILAQNLGLEVMSN